ncbi:MAG: PAS domain S-box protein [Deltaproteobacteria bacterium]|nr:PAS domain S-box protein [Deltaproteobacteria bacterium]
MNENNEDKLRQIEWLLEKSVQEPGTRETSYAPPYGDITELNTIRLIMDSVGKDMLQEIAENAIDLLETSVAVYEANGDYAFGMFSSGWCRFMDAASRSLCNTDDNQEALNCGRWLCHENCWNDSAKPAMKSGHSTDIECVGGIRLYAEPIYAGDQVIGVINIGYGDPPAHPEQLKMLAERFGVDPEKLREIAESYRPRPKVIVDLAKKQLRSWAKLIGNTVERIQAQKAKSESEALLSRTQQLSHVGSWGLDVPENRLTWSDETYRIFGLNPQEFDATYEAFLDVVHPDDRAKVDKAYSDSLGKGKDTYEIEYRIVRRHSGEIRHVYEKCVHERDTAGMIVRSIGMIQDITERKEAQAALRESEERYRAIYDQSPIGIELYDQAGMLLDVNKACLNMFGVQNVQDLRGFGLFSDPNLEEEYKERLRNGKYVRYEVLFDFEKVKEAGLYDTSRSGSIWLDVLITPTFWDSFRGYLVQVQDITTQKQAEEELRESHQRLEFALQGGELGMWDWNPQDGAVVYSDLWAQMLEYRPDEVEPTVDFFKQHVHPEDLAAVLDRLTGHVEGRLPVYESEHRLCTKSGNYFWVLDRGRIVERDKDGRPMRVTGLIADITKRKQAEEALRKSEERFRNLYDDAPVGYFEYDLRGNIIRVNRTELKMLGYSAEEMIGQPCWKFIVDEAAREQILAKLAGAKPPAVGLERTYRRKDGTTFPVLFEDRLLTDDNGHITGIRTAIQDITERKQAEKALRESEERYRLLFENATVAIFIVQDETLKFVNPKTEKMIGYTPKELTKSPFVEFIHPEDREMVRERYLRRLKGENPISTYPFRVLHKSGEELTVELNAVLIDWEGKPATLNFLRDITEQKRIEAQLQQAQKMESVGTLAGGIAHDFNNILSPLMIHAEMALMELPSESPLQRHVKQIYQASERARDLVKQILTFARKQEASRAPIKVSLMVKEVAKFLRSTIPKTIAIQYDIQTDQDMVLGDVTELNQLIVNLSTNAAHAMEERGGSLVIRLGNETFDARAVERFSDLEPGPYVVLRVEDTGEGIEPQVLDKIFEPYFTTKETGKGTGIGLAVVHGIVKSYGGDITVDSDPGKGACFTVYLPQVRDDGDRTRSKNGAFTFPRGNERILFVDDEEAVMGAVRPMLEALGYSVTAKRSSVEALASFTEDPDAFDLIITDQTMPEMTGKELAREMLAIRPELPIILYTGYSPQIDEERAKAMGIQGFVMKPIVMKEMANTIREVLDSV